jgi:hypothetical protein
LSESDDDALVALSDPQIEVHSVFAAVGGAVYQGHDGVRRWQQDLEESWSGEFRVESRRSSTSVTKRSCPLPYTALVA